MFRRSDSSKPLAFLVLVLAILFVIGISATALAQSNEQQKTATAAQPANTTVSAQHVAIDPVTHQLRQPTAEEARALAAQMQAPRSTKALKAVKHANGSKSIVLNDQFMETMVARVNSDGSVSEGYVKTAKEAEAFLAADQKKQTSKNAKPAAAPAEEER